MKSDKKKSREKDTITQKIRAEVAGVKMEIRNKVSSYIVTAFGLVAGLAWNDAVKALIEHLFPANASTIWAKFTYAILITLVVVVVSAYLVRFLKQEEKRVEEEVKKEQESN